MDPGGAELEEEGVNPVSIAFGFYLSVCVVLFIILHLVVAYAKTQDRMLMEVRDAYHRRPDCYVIALVMACACWPVIMAESCYEWLTWRAKG
jgi:hypothetical protein